MSERYTINLPWPHKDLSPNARGHWGKKATATKKARADGYKASQAAGAHKIAAGAAHVTTTFFPPTKASFDDDNLQARCKAYFDGIADAIGLDDKHFKHAPVQRGEVRKLGAVLIELEISE